jgi:hypothetical protein
VFAALLQGEERGFGWGFADVRQALSKPLAISSQLHLLKAGDGEGAGF